MHSQIVYMVLVLTSLHHIFPFTQSEKGIIIRFIQLLSLLLPHYI